MLRFPCFNPTSSEFQIFLFWKKQITSNLKLWQFYLKTKKLSALLVAIKRKGLADDQTVSAKGKNTNIKPMT